MNTKTLLNAPPDAIGALYFLPGQYLFKRIENESESVKALSSEQISRAFRNASMDTGWIERRVLRYSEKPEGNYVLSFEPAQIRTIFVEFDDGNVAEIKLALPTLVLFGHKKEIHIWAAKGKRITKETRLAIAPLPNVGGGSGGKICFGSNDVPEASLETLDAVWKLIFTTPFNRDQADKKCRSEPGDVRKLFLSLSYKNAKTFPASELIESRTTIEEAWLQFVR